MSVNLGNVAFGGGASGLVFGTTLGTRFFEPKFAAVGIASGAAATAANQAVGGGPLGVGAGFAAGEATAFGGVLAFTHGHMNRDAAFATACMGAFSGIIASNF